MCESMYMHVSYYAASEREIRYLLEALFFALSNRQEIHVNRCVNVCRCIHVCMYPIMLVVRKE
jgi:predicted acetyltransferase